MKRNAMENIISHSCRNDIKNNGEPEGIKLNDEAVEHSRFITFIALNRTR